MKKFTALMLSIASLAGCAQQNSEVSHEYPKTWEERQKADMGKLTGSDGFVIAGGSSSKASNKGIGVNAYLWGATLDFIHKMPLASADPFGGIIMTDWYQVPNQQDVRYKLNVYILGSEMRSDSLRVRVTKHVILQDGLWHEVDADSLAAEIEDKILLRAREIKYKNNQ
jgi:uncharacterized lipoprotein